jgi:hypothetical protein
MTMREIALPLLTFVLGAAGGAMSCRWYLARHQHRDRFFPPRSWLRPPSED